MQSRFSRRRWLRYLLCLSFIGSLSGTGYAKPLRPRPLEAISPERLDEMLAADTAAAMIADEADWQIAIDSYIEHVQIVKEITMARLETIASQITTIVERRCSKNGPLPRPCADLVALQCNVIAFPLSQFERIADSDNAPAAPLFKRAAEGYFALAERSGNAACPNRMELYWHAAKGFRRSGNVDRAIVAAERGIAIDSTAAPDIRRELAYSIGAMHASVGRYEQAATAYEAFSRKFSKADIAPTVLSDAIAIRLRLHQLDRAVLDADFFDENYAQKRDENAAVFHAVAWALDSQGAATKLRKRFIKKAYELAMQGSDVFDIRLSASVLLAKSLILLPPRSAALRSSLSETGDVSAATKLLNKVIDAKDTIRMDAGRASDDARADRLSLARNAIAQAIYLRGIMQARPDSITPLKDALVALAELNLETIPHWALMTAGELARLSIEATTQLSRKDPNSLRLEARSASRIYLELAKRLGQTTPHRAMIEEWMGSQFPNELKPLKDLLPRGDWVGRENPPARAMPFNGY